MLDLRRIGGVACDYVADPLDKLLTNRTYLPTVGRPVPCNKRDQPPSTDPHTYLPPVAAPPAPTDQGLHGLEPEDLTPDPQTE